MKNKNIKILGLAACTLLCGGLLSVVNGQDATASKMERRPKMKMDDSKKTYPVAAGKNLYCAGYIQSSPIDEKIEIVGGEQEQDRYTFLNGDYIYINAGADQGVKVGEKFSVIRPRGKMTSRFTKKGNLGKYVQELGEVEVISIKEKVSVVKILSACEMVLLGDLLVPAQEKFSPLQRSETLLNRFAEPNGKATGRIVLSRDTLETVSTNQIVYIDLSVDDNVKVGDYLTIYRPLGKGNITGYKDGEIVRDKDYGFQSEVYRGGEYSNQSPRRGKRDAEGLPLETTPKAKAKRPRDLRKIVGEMVILNVKEKTATAVITQIAQEVHTGDFVELQ